MYKNVRLELVRKDMTITDLARESGIRYQTLSEKLRGNSPITFDEACAIKRALNTDMALEELFAVTVTA